MITIANANALHIPLPDQSVQCIVTSPPYYGLRDYGTAKWEGGSSECDHVASERYYTEKTAAVSSSEAFSEPGEANKARIKSGRWRESGCCVKCGARRIDAQIGLEASPAAYVASIVAVMRECRRVLKDDGTLWLNLGDSYARNGGTPGGGNRELIHLENIQARMTKIPDGCNLKEKDLIGIPWRVAFALQDDGWFLRQDIIWSKPNPMPESVTDRCTKAHEYIFLLTKRARYYYDADAIRNAASTPIDSSARQSFGGPKLDDSVKAHAVNNGKAYRDERDGFRNRRSVWTVATSPYSGAHFATFPPALIEPMILAGTSARGECPHCGKAWVRIVERTLGDSEANDRPKKTAGMASHGSTLSLSGNGSKEWAERGSKSNTIGWRPQCNCISEVYPDIELSSSGWDEVIDRTAKEFAPIPQTVLDPFAGSGTTGAVAIKHGRRAVLLDLNTKYIDLQFERTNGVQITMPLETIAPNSPA